MLDRNFLLTPRKSSPPTPISSQPQLIFTSPESLSSTQGPRLQLSFRTSLPSVQIYSAPGLDGSGPGKKSAHQQHQKEEGSDEGKKKGYDKDGALFIEFQQPVGTLSHTCAIDAKPDNELKKWLKKRVETLELEDAKEGGERSWELDSLLRKGQIWESWVEVEVRKL